MDSIAWGYVQLFFIVIGTSLLLIVVPWIIVERIVALVVWIVRKVKNKGKGGTTNGRDDTIAIVRGGDGNWPF